MRYFVFSYLSWGGLLKAGLLRTGLVAAGLGMSLLLPLTIFSQDSSGLVPAPKVVDSSPNNRPKAPLKTPVRPPTGRAAANAKKQPEPRIELNLNEVDLKSFIDLISKATNTSFLFEDSIAQSKKVTLLSTRSFTPREAYRIFENILDINGYTTVKEGPYVRIINKAEARTYQTPVSESVVGEITQGDFVTMVIAVQNTDTNVMRTAITPFLSPNTITNSYPQTNLLMFRDTRDVVRKIVDLVQVLDRKNFNLEIARISIQYGDINQITKVVTDLMITRTGLKNLFLLPENNGRFLLTIGTKASLNQVEKYVRALDIPMVQKEYAFFTPKYAQAADLVKMAKTMLPTPQANQVVRVDVIEEARSNRVLILGVPSEIAQMKIFLEQVDVPLTGVAPTYKIFRLNNSNAEEISRTLQGVTRSLSTTALTIDPRASSTPGSTPAPTPAQANQAVQAPQPARPAAGPASAQSGANTNLVIVADVPTNSLVVFGSPSELFLVSNLIQELDVLRSQVYLEVMILEVSLNKSLNLGINWKAAGTSNGVLGGIAGGGATSLVPSSLSSLANESAGASIGILGPALTYQGQTFASYSAFIQAMSGDNDFNVVSNPQILTLVNQEAMIRVGEVRPFQTSSRVDVNNNVTTTYDYKEVGVTLKFTAQVSADDSIRLKIDQSTKNVASTVRSAAATNFTPTTIERNISTNIITKNNEIVVLGGLISENSNSVTNKTTCLGDIPVIGWLFKSSNDNNNKTNLLVYIKPRILRTEQERSDAKYGAEQNFNQTKVDTMTLIRQKVNFGQKVFREEIKDLQALPSTLSETKAEPTIQEPVKNPAEKTDKAKDATQDSTARN